MLENIDVKLIQQKMAPHTTVKYRKKPYIDNRFLSSKHIKNKTICKKNIDKLNS